MACPERSESVEKPGGRKRIAVRQGFFLGRFGLANLESSEIVFLPTSLRWCLVLASVFERGDPLTFLSFAPSPPGGTVQRRSTVVAIALGAA